MDHRLKVAHHVQKFYSLVSRSESSLLSDLASSCSITARSPQRRQVFLQRLPHAARRHVFVVVAIEVSGRGHFSPRNGGGRRAFSSSDHDASEMISRLRMTHADDGIEPNEVVAQTLESSAVPRSALGRLDVKEHVAERAACFSEGMDGITCGRRAQMRLERRAVDHINWPLEEIGDPLIDDLRVGHRSSRPQAHMPPPVCRGHCPAGFCHAQPSRIRRRAPRRARAKRSHGDEERQGHPERSGLKI